jgi:hypothetical protein
MLMIFDRKGKGCHVVDGTAVTSYCKLCKIYFRTRMNFRVRMSANTVPENICCSKNSVEAIHVKFMACSDGPDAVEFTKIMETINSNTTELQGMWNEQEVLRERHSPRRQGIWGESEEAHAGTSQLTESLSGMQGSRSFASEQRPRVSSSTV